MKKPAVCVFPGIPFGDLSCGHPSTPCGTIPLPMSTEFLLLELVVNAFKVFKEDKELLR